MNYTKAILTVIFLGLIFANLGILSATYALCADHESTVYDCWNTLQEFEGTSNLRNALVEKEWMWDDTAIQDLDYILVLTQQLNREFFPNVPPALVLAVISVESGFEPDMIGYSNDTGLMQIIPKWHEDRIAKYIYDENVDLTDPRLNVMVGMDYLDELLIEAEGDVSLALMMYNEGPTNGKRDHIRLGDSMYARRVMERMEYIDDVLEGRK